MAAACAYCQARGAFILALLATLRGSNNAAMACARQPFPSTMRYTQQPLLLRDGKRATSSFQARWHVLCSMGDTALAWATCKAPKTAKKGSPTPTRKRNIKSKSNSTRNKEKHKSTTINNPSFSCNIHVVFMSSMSSRVEVSQQVSRVTSRPKQSSNGSSKRSACMA
ncbi:hypothetical protein HAX54_050412 [Datura stramonium]|uniref:Secreted protein n=1 Tax=Datura stramonium TaxID=4076 RepID=A0ABS8RU97_DATST|nr:hypothetical protein [Datura stramonium]